MHSKDFLLEQTLARLLWALSLDRSQTCPIKTQTLTHFPTFQGHVSTVSPFKCLAAKTQGCQKQSVHSWRRSALPQTLWEDRSLTSLAPVSKPMWLSCGPTPLPTFCNVSLDSAQVPTNLPLLFSHQSTWSSLHKSEWSQLFPSPSMVTEKKQFVLV